MTIETDNALIPIERITLHNIKIIDLSYEEKPIEVYTGSLFPSKGEQLLN